MIDIYAMHFRKSDGTILENRTLIQSVPAAHEGDIKLINPKVSQKIGNAIRTIDTWYPDFGTEAGVGPIPVDPYGAITTMGKAFRSPQGKKDFYTLFDKFASGESLECVEDEHFVMAVMIRGGVFGKAGA